MNCGSKPFVVEIRVHRQELCAAVPVISCCRQCGKFFAGLGQDIMLSMNFGDHCFHGVANFGEIVRNFHDLMRRDSAAQRLT